MPAFTLCNENKLGMANAFGALGAGHYNLSKYILNF